MVIKVKLLGPLAEYGCHLDKDRLTLEKGALLSDIVRDLRLPPQSIRLILLNKRYTSLDAELSDGDTVMFFPPIGGG